MSKKLKCLSTFMAASVLTGLIGSTSIFADTDEIQPANQSNVVSYDDTYEVVNSKPVDIDDDADADCDDTNLSNEIVWEVNVII